MQDHEDITPALVIEYTDEKEGFQGWLVINSIDHNLCAGGMRVQKGLSKDHLIKMASNMTCKMRICGLRVDGAKSGIDYDPALPGKHAAMARFLKAISPYVRNRYSMGPDLNVEMSELDSIGQELGLASVKMAVAHSQGWDLSYFNQRYQILSQDFEGWPLGKIRVGFGVAVAALTVLEYLDTPCDVGSVVIQGFGALAKAAAFGLDRKGVKVMAIADHEKSIISVDGKGIDVRQILGTVGPLLPEQGYGPGVRMGSPEEIISVASDIFIPAAVENTVTAQVASQLHARAVVPGANLAVAPEADQLLFQKGIVVLPDLLSGSGGSLSMEGLFGPEDHPSPADIIAHVEQRMSGIVNETLKRSNKDGVSPARAAYSMCSEVASHPGTKPYGDPH